ncbi:tautomerase family protein [Xenorhabdus bovienii]|uniref:tautomerase family protein n=1 Tax=Xenorhabdus bovienii TaxID=40576 RepID=UPI0023B2BDD5|nr:tautomerase family protein [Xenorhabdus bovienii]MDE9555326.1 tautomerase family protein [Xenorhabdus bovienii]
MPVIQVTTWKMNNEQNVQRLIEDITRAVHEHCGAPLDKISIIINEVSPSRWADAGVLGNDPAFPQKSRRKTYEETL